MKKKWKIVAVLLAVSVAVAFLPVLAFAVEEEGDEDRPFEVFVSPHYTCMEEGEEDLNSSQVIPGMELCLCADVDDGTENPEGYSYQWAIDSVDNSDSVKDLLKDLGLDASLFVSFNEGKDTAQDAMVRFRPWEEVKNAVAEKCKDELSRKSAVDTLEEALREGFKVNFTVKATKGEDSVTEKLDIDLNDEYAELCPVDEFCMAELLQGQTEEITPEFYLIKTLDNDNDPIREKQKIKKIKWVKGAPWTLKEYLDEGTQKAIEAAYKNDKDQNPDGKDYDWEDEDYALQYCWENNCLPEIKDGDPDVSISKKEGTEGTFSLERRSDEDFEITLYVSCEEWNEGKPDTKLFHFNNIGNDGDDEDNYPWELCFRGEDDNNQAYNYTVDSKDDTIAVDDLGITVKNEQDEVVPGNGYKLTITRTWYDEEKEKDMEEPVGEKIGIHDTNKDEGLTEYQATVTVDAGKGPVTMAQSRFFVVDRHSLNFVASSAAFDNAIDQDGWRMMGGRFWFAPGELKGFRVFSADHRPLKEGKDYVITWYKRTGEGSADVLPPKPTEEILVASEAMKLSAAPTEPGEYFAVYEGKGDYYGGNNVLVDIVSDEKAAAYINAYEVYIGDKEGWARYFVDEGESMEMPAITLKRGTIVLDPSKYDLEVKREVAAAEGQLEKIKPAENGKYYLTHAESFSGAYQVSVIPKEGSGFRGETSRWIDVCSRTCLTPVGPELCFKDAEKYKMSLENQFIGWQRAYSVPSGITLEPQVIIDGKELEAKKDYTCRYAGIPEIGLPLEEIQNLDLKYSEAFPTDPGCYLCEIEGTGTKGEGYYGKTSILRVQVKQCTHKLTETAAKDPTYEAEGNSAYWTCSECGKHFSDAEGKNEIGEGSWVIAKLIPEKNDIVPLEDGSSIIVLNTSVNTASYIAPKDQKGVTIPSTTVVGDTTYKITTISANAFKGTAATAAVIGKNVTSMKAKAFNGSKVKTLTVKSTKLTKKSVKNAFKGSKTKKVTIKVKVGNAKTNKKYVKKYKTIFTKKNVGVAVVVK